MHFSTRRTISAWQCVWCPAHRHGLRPSSVRGRGVSRPPRSIPKPVLQKPRPWAYLGAYLQRTRRLTQSDQGSQPTPPRTLERPAEPSRCRWDLFLIFWWWKFKIFLKRREESNITLRSCHVVQVYLSRIQMVGSEEIIN